MYLLDKKLPIYVPVANPPAYETAIQILLISVLSASLTIKNQINTSTKPIKLAVIALPFIVTIVRVVPNETSSILTYILFVFIK